MVVCEVPSHKLIHLLLFQYSTQLVVLLKIVRPLASAFWLTAKAFRCVVVNCGSRSPPVPLLIISSAENASAAFGVPVLLPIVACAFVSAAQKTASKKTQIENRFFFIVLIIKFLL
jgi:hypothetical protein